YCPAGLHYACISQSTPTCPAGSHYNKAQDRCLKASPPVCHSGSHFDSSRFQCVKDSPPICKHGSHFDSRQSQCVKDSQPICHYGTHYKRQWDICARKSSYTCSEGSLSGKSCNGQVVPFCSQAGCWYTCTLTNDTEFFGHNGPSSEFIDQCCSPAQRTCPSGTHYTSWHQDWRVTVEDSRSSGMRSSSTRPQSA